MQPGHRSTAPRPWHPAPFVPRHALCLQVSKIANVKSEISRRHGHAIAVDANYICYGLKGGQIRILNRHTGARTLLKDHAAPVTDLRFFRHDSERCLLASVDTTGQVRMRDTHGFVHLCAIHARSFHVSCIQLSLCSNFHSTMHLCRLTHIA